MRLPTVILCFYIGVQISQSKCLKKLTEINNSEFKLQRYLKSCNDFLMPPRRNLSAPFNVMLRFALKSFYYLSSEQEFFISTWTVLAWDDMRIEWNPSEFNGIESTLKYSNHIWTPKFKLLNNIEDYDNVDLSFSSIPCEMSSSGNVYCTTLRSFRAKCVADLSDWPRDEQTCSLIFGAHPEQEGIGTNISLNFGERAISIMESKYGSEWDIMNYEQKQEADKRGASQLKMSFTLVRQAEVLVAIVIYPSVILSVLSLSTLMLDVRRDLRLLVTCYSMLCHFYFLSKLAMVVPEHSNNPPKILLYFRSSIIMTAVNVACTLLLNTLCHRNVPVPTWIAVTNEYAFKCYKFGVFPRWRIENSDDGSDDTNGWTQFANLISTVWFYVSFIVYTVLYCKLVPSERSWSQSVN